MLGWARVEARTVHAAISLSPVRDDNAPPELREYQPPWRVFALFVHCCGEEKYIPLQPLRHEMNLWRDERRPLPPIFVPLEAHSFKGVIEGHLTVECAPSVPDLVFKLSCN